MHIVFIVPGSLTTVSGGYAYDRRMIVLLREAGHRVDVEELGGRHPLPAAHAAWAALPNDAVPIIDGLALPAFASRADGIGARRTVGLLHHPTSLETGLSDEDAAALRAVEQALMPRLDRAVVTSDLTGKTLVDAFGVAADRIAVVVPGTDDAPHSPGSGGPGCEILSLGSFTPRKGHDVLLRSLAKLFDLDWRLTIAGAERDSVHAHALEALAEECGVAQRVTFLGALTGGALEKLWQRTDLFALATHYEGYGMAIAEALKRGIPVAVTSGGAAGALVTPEAGVVCAPGDEVTLSKSLRRLIFDVPLRRAAAEAAFAVGQTLPDWPTQALAFAAALS